MSEIEYHNLRSVTAREVCRALEQDGFTLARQRGSHQRYTHPDGRRVTVPFTRRGKGRVDRNQSSDNLTV